MKFKKTMIATLAAASLVASGATFAAGFGPNYSSTIVTNADTGQTLNLTLDSQLIPTFTTETLTMSQTLSYCHLNKINGGNCTITVAAPGTAPTIIATGNIHVPNIGGLLSGQKITLTMNKLKGLTATLNGASLKLNVAASLKVLALQGNNNIVIK